MIRDEQIPELSHLRLAELRMPIHARADLGSLVVFGANETSPVHNWFRFKEGFSADLLSTIIREFGDLLPRKQINLLDPFCGSGTSLISAQFEPGRQICGVGIERNPFIHFIAQTKANWRSMDANNLVSDGEAAIEEASDFEPGLPGLSSIQSGRCISNHIARRLMAISEAVARNQRNLDFLRLGIAASIEPLSKVRRDGRALRIVEKPRKLVRNVLTEKWQRMADDVSAVRRKSLAPSSPVDVRLGDGRDPSACGIPNGSIDLILTSPPYPNNIDYSEVYKLELWMLGFIQTRKDFLKLRHSTVRSHPTFDRAVALNPSFMEEVENGSLRTLLGGMTERLEESGESWRARMLLGYFSDLWNAISSYRSILAPKGIAAFVIGNSLHGSQNPALIASDIILANIAENLGFRSKILIARGLKRRLAGNHFLRESVVLLTR